MRKLILILLVLISIGPAATAAVYVSQDSPGPMYNGRSWATAYHTVSDALNLTTSGDIWVKGGVYYERITLGKYRNIFGGFSGIEKNITARKKTNPPTILDAGFQGRAIDTQIGAFCTIDGLEIRNGRADRGAGIRCQTNAKVNIINCRIENCYASEMGGGVYYGTYTLGGMSGCVLSGNRAANGAGLVVEYHSYPTVQNTLIVENEAFLNGGGVYCPYHSGAKIANCTIACNNSGVSGGGAYTYQGGPVSFSSCIIAFNDSPAASGVFCGGAASSVTITKCCFWANNGGNFGGAQRIPLFSSMNIYQDPMFVDPSVGNFGLLPGSRCAVLGIGCLGL